MKFFRIHEGLLINLSLPMSRVSWDEKNKILTVYYYKQTEPLTFYVPKDKWEELQNVLFIHE